LYKTVALEGKSLNQIWLEIQQFAGLIRESREETKRLQGAVPRIATE